ncbi:SIMPL domain-containing protein [Shewanella algae]|uniref:SIMPL domain-containing protein n=1 Tax=Shewanella algae TaxID=38313 RepID=UPI00163F0304|nr:SIMPL domain-containing protein [Shewanella algae]QNH99439.1 SIMPL domain-containing protein [Shewanella algae]
MSKNYSLAALLLGGFICAGLLLLGTSIGNSLLAMKGMERTVAVKGLAEREVKANVAIWPIRFNEVDNDLNTLYQTVQQKTDKVTAFLEQQGFNKDEISVSLPSIEDRQAQGYVDPNVKYRYAARVTVSLYTHQVDLLLESRNKLLALAKEGIAIASQDYDSRTEFLFTELNSIKPAMVQEATQNAREVAEKFAKDSNSVLGKIKQASQGTFTISDRDSNTPYIKKVRIVSTLTYYLND